MGSLARPGAWRPALLHGVPARLQHQSVENGSRPPLHQHVHGQQHPAWDWVPFQGLRQEWHGPLRSVSVTYVGRQQQQRYMQNFRCWCLIKTIEKKKKSPSWRELDNLLVIAAITLIYKVRWGKRMFKIWLYYCSETCFVNVSFGFYILFMTCCNYPLRVWLRDLLCRFHSKAFTELSQSTCWVCCGISRYLYCWNQCAS